MAIERESDFEGLSTKEDFNRSLRHFQLVMDIVAEFDSSRNLADILNGYLADKEVQREQIKPILNSLLVDRYSYQFASHNLKENVEKFEPIVAEMKKWTAVDLIIAYYSPELGLSVINPKNEDHWKAIRVIKKHELLTLYCGAFGKAKVEKAFNVAIKSTIELLEGRKIKTPANLTGGAFKAPKEPKAKKAPRKTAAKKSSAKKASAPVAQAKPAVAEKQPSGRATMTPLYGIPVTNELFHNGNVEAWKKIIESYETYHQGLKVFVFYDGERINDINTLFKWGKVKRGTAIMVAVAGEVIRNVAKLQRYLRQGASPLFEAFLKGHPNQVLQLF
jgi:hypothetical protein